MVGGEIFRLETEVAPPDAGEQRATFPIFFSLQVEHEVQTHWEWSSLLMRHTGLV